MSSTDGGRLYFRGDRTRRVPFGRRVAVAYERSGAGPPVVLVDPAGAYRAFGPMRSLGAVLAREFTVVAYDRRGRGESTDTLPYAVEREVEDLAAVLEVAGGSAFVYGVSSGGLLALHAAASGLAISKLAVFEPPLAAHEEKAAQSEFTVELADLVFDGRRREAVEFFLSSIGVPAEVVARMAGDLPTFDAIAHTLVYDSLISEATSADVLRAVTAPTLVLDSEASSADLTGSAAALMAALPSGRTAACPASGTAWPTTCWRPFSPTPSGPPQAPEIYARGSAASPRRSPCGSSASSGPAARPVDIVVGWDCALWFPQAGQNTGVGRISTAGAVTEYPVLIPGAHVSGITVALDGNIWFTESFANKNGRLETDPRKRLCAGRDVRMPHRATVAPFFQRHPGARSGPSSILWSAGSDARARCRSPSITSCSASRRASR